MTSHAAEFGEFVFHVSSGRLLKGGEPVYLTTGEQACFAHIGRSARTAGYSGDVPASATGDVGDGNERSWNVLINRVRKDRSKLK